MNKQRTAGFLLTDIQ